MSIDETPLAKGRPRGFSDDEVLDALVQLFWEKGYEATSMADVVKVSGLNKSSLYNSFGSKDELFARALNRYIDFRSQMVTQFLLDGTGGLDDIYAMLGLLRFEVESDDHRGCLAINTSTELGHRDQGMVEMGNRYRSIMRAGFLAALQRAGQAGEIDADKAEGYSRVLLTMFLGMAVLVRSGATNNDIFDHLDAVGAIVDSWRIG